MNVIRMYILTMLADHMTYQRQLRRGLVDIECTLQNLARSIWVLLFYEYCVSVCQMQPKLNIFLNKWIDSDKKKKEHHFTDLFTGL